MVKSTGLGGVTAVSTNLITSYGGFVSEKFKVDYDNSVRGTCSYQEFTLLILMSFKV
jgi:hypothetical protein